MNDDDFKLNNKAVGFKGYVSKPDITSVGAEFLIKGSKNVLIDFAFRIISRKGYTVYNGVNTGGTGIKSSYDWDSSNGRQFPIRVHDGKIEFSWNGVWNILKSGFPTSTFEFTKVWDNTEKEDVLLGVCGDTNMYKWSGGVAKIRSATANTITKQGVMTSVSTIAFVAGTTGTIAATITDTGNNFLNAGFAVGDTLNVSGSANNSRNFTIGSVVAGTITLIMSDVLTSEVAGTSVTLHNGEPTWASSRFLTAGTRSIRLNGTDYTYTGGETTDTLIGLVAFPFNSISIGTPIWQSLITLANPSAINANFKQDFIATQLNQIILASSKSQEVYISSTSDYTNFTLTSPRGAGDPAKLVMDACCTGIIPIDNPQQTTSSVMFGAGHNEFFKLNYQMSQDNTNELVRMIKLKTATGSGLVAVGCFTPVHNATAYISREPSLNILGAVENIDGKTNVPLSDIVKDDFDSYDFTNSHVIYWRRAIYITLPDLGIVLIYDLMRNLWQPPQTIPISRFAIIDDWLHGHSSITDETYRLFTGTNDNGNFIPQRARLGYDNGGRRDRLKNFSERWSDGYISAAGVLNINVGYGFDGALGIKPFQILGNDSSVVIPASSNPLGNDSEGSHPLGGATLDISASLTGMLRFAQIDTMPEVDCFEHYVEYSMNTLDAQFALVGTGDNKWDAGSVPIGHKK